MNGYVDGTQGGNPADQIANQEPHPPKQESEPEVENEDESGGEDDFPETVTDAAAMIEAAATKTTITNMMGMASVANNAATMTSEAAQNGVMLKGYADAGAAHVTGAVGAASVETGTAKSVTSQFSNS